jgi:hypothetical protein
VEVDQVVLSRHKTRSVLEEAVLVVILPVLATL